MANRSASISTTVRIRVISKRSSRLTSATRKPRWPIPTIKPGQALAQRRGADFVALDQIDDAEACAGRQVACDDIALHQARRAFAQRIGFRHFN
jgi:hypothetical protein